MSAHTTGPWFTQREGRSTVYIEARIRPGVLQEVAACGPTEAGQDQQEANARLIAAAPDLLEALELLFGSNAMHSVCRHEGADVFGRVKGTWSAEAEEKARAAIAKAGGAA